MPWNERLETGVRTEYSYRIILLLLLYYFVGRRSTTEETTAAAAAAHLGVTTLMFFLIFVLVTSLRVLYNIHHNVNPVSYTHLTLPTILRV